MLGKVKELRPESRMIRCRDQFQAQRYREPRGEENRLDRACESAKEGEQNCLYEVRTYDASTEEQPCKTTVNLPISRTSLSWRKME